FPGVILDVVLASASENVPVDASVGTPSIVPTATLNSAPTIDKTDAPAVPPADCSCEDKFIEEPQVTSALAAMPIGDIGTCTASTGPSVVLPSSPSKVETASKTALSFMEALKCASKKAKELDRHVPQQERNAEMAYMIKLLEASEVKQEELSQLQKQALNQQEEMKQLVLKHQEEIKRLALEHQEEVKQLHRASDAKQEEVKQLQNQALDQQEEMKQLALDHHEEIKQLQIKALGQLAELQDRVKALLTQTYELHEYPVPRLFVVLPQDPSRWDTVDPFSNKFRLYFLCECGEHTKSIDSQTNIPHHIHVAKHEGYEIKRPSEFFQRYGSYVLIILKMLTFGVKLGITVAGVAIPGLPFVISAESIGQVATSAKHWQESIEHGVSRAIGHIDNVLTHDNGAVDQVETKEALEGADLRKLDTFLKAKDGDKVLGNLYRTVTDKGHVKWVCIDHYRENYQESTAQDFQRMLNSVGGSFDRSIARSVYELDVVFDWACTTSDLEVLEGALKASRVSILRLGIQQFRISNLSSTSAQYGVLLRIKGLPNMRIIHTILSKDVIKLLSIQPKISPCFCKLSIEATPGSVGGKELTTIAEVLKTNSTLTALDLTNNSSGDSGAGVLAEALKTNTTLSSLSLNNNNIGDNGARSLAYALKTNKTLTTLSLEDNFIKFNGALALSESLKTNLTLTTLNLDWKSIIFIRVEGLTVALKSNSTVATLNLESNSIGDDGAKALADALTTNST
ncbi:hypothetical protein BGZ70_004873, partial [Mortierella alpina]